MASTDAKAIPVKNAALRITFPIFDADGDLVSGAAGLDSEVSKDGGAFADCTNEATEIGSSGMYTLDLTSTEMNADTVAVIVKTSTSGAKTTPIVLYTAARSINDLATQTSVDTIDDFVDTEVAAILAAVDTEVAAIKAVTDALPNAGALTTIQADLDNIQTRLPAALVSGRMDSSVGAMAANVVTAAAIAADAIGASELAADAVTEIQNGLATAAGLNAVGSSLGAALTSIQADTDNLQTRLPAALTADGNIKADALKIEGTDPSDLINAAADTALTDYDGPTHAELVSEIDAVQADIAALTIPTAAGIADAVWDEDLSLHLGAGSTGEALSDAGAAGTPPTADEIAQAVLTKPIADVEAGTHPFRSLYGMIAKLVNKTSTSPTTLTVTETDDTTVLATQTLTRDATATPVTAVDTDA